MYTIHILVRCSKCSTEILPEELEQAEFMVEVLVSQVLLELFGVVIVDNVTISFSPFEQDEDKSFLQRT